MTNDPQQPTVETPSFSTSTIFSGTDPRAPAVTGLFNNVEQPAVELAKVTFVERLIGLYNLNPNAAINIIVHYVSRDVECDDGFGSAWVVLQFLNHLRELGHSVPMNIKLLKGIYSEPIGAEAFEVGDMVLFADFSYAPEIMYEIASKVGLDNFLVLDHHASSIEKYTAFVTKQAETQNSVYKHLHAPTVSGTKATFLFFGGKTSPLVDYISDGDLFRFELPEAKAVQAKLRSNPYSFDYFTEFDDRLRREYDFAGIVGGGKSILEDRQRKIGQLMSYAQPVFVNGVEGLAVNTNIFFASDLGSELASKSGTFGMTYYNTGSGRYNLSLRSLRGTVTDVKVLAESLGGGGHVNASGAEVSVSTLLTLLRSDPLYQNGHRSKAFYQSFLDSKVDEFNILIEESIKRIDDGKSLDAEYEELYLSLQAMLEGTGLQDSFTLRIKEDRQTYAQKYKGYFRGFLAFLGVTFDQYNTVKKWYHSVLPYHISTMAINEEKVTDILESRDHKDVIADRLINESLYEHYSAIMEKPTRTYDVTLAWPKEHHMLTFRFSLTK